MKPITASSNSADAARSIQIDFELQYVECDLADERFENHPVVQLYLSRQFDRRATTGGQLSIPLDEHRLGKVYSGTLKGTLSRKYNGIPSMSAIGIRSYAQHREDHGHPCFVNVGTSHAYMHQILGEYDQKVQYDHQHDLLMRTTVVGVYSLVKKGVVRLTVKRVQLGHGITGLDSAASPLQAPIAQTEQLLSEYIQRTLHIEQQLPDVIDGMQRIRAPMDISQEGIESTGDAFLPIAAFAMCEVPETNANFYINAMETVMRRRNLKREQFKTLSQHEKVRILGLMIGHSVQSLDYIGDSVELSNRKDRFARRQKVGTEEFSDLFYTLAGDCEDGARAALAVQKGLHNTHFVDADMNELKRISQKYIPMMTLAVVHGAKAGDHTEQVGAHMYLAMVPEHQMREGLQRTAPGRQMLSQMGPMEAYRGKSPFVSAPSSTAARSSHATTLKDLPPISVEGTGVIDPLGYKDPLLEKRRYLAQHMTAYTWAKTEIPHEEQGESGFYYVDVSGVTSHYIDQGVNIGSFWYGTVDPEHHSYTGMKRGVLYTDRLKDSDRFALMPQPPMSKQMMDVIEAAIALQPPPRPLTLHYDQDMGPDTHSLLDELCEHVESLGRDASGAGDSVDLYILPSQLTRAEIDQMKSNAYDAERLVKAAYTKENVTNDIWIYRVQLYIK